MFALKRCLNKNFKALEGFVTKPRFGFAYSPLGERKTLLRGGVGLFANTFQGSITSNIFGNAPNKFSPTVSTGTAGMRTYSHAFDR